MKTTTYDPVTVDRVLGANLDAATNLYHLAHLAAKALVGQNYYGMTADEKALVSKLERMGFLAPHCARTNIIGQTRLPKTFPGYIILVPR